MSLTDKESIPYHAFHGTNGALRRQMQSSVRTLTTICSVSWISGMFIFGVSEWVHTDPASQESTHITITVLSLSGVVVFVSGVYGCWGSLHVRHEFICSYTFILLACSVVQVCCGAIFLTLTGESVREDTLQQVRTASTEYTKFFRLQKEYSCCGAQSYNDWIDTLWWREEREVHSFLVVPDSCCIEKGCNKGEPPFNNVTNITQVHHKGCSEVIVSRRNLHFWVVGCSALAEGFFLLAAYFFAHYLVNVIVKLELECMD